MSEKAPIAVYGAGGFGREVAWLAESCQIDDRPVRVVCFVDDQITGEIHSIPILSLPEAVSRYAGVPMVCGIGNPKIREVSVKKAQAAGFDFASLVHQNTQMSSYVTFDEGVIICAGNILTTDISIGRHVQINLSCTIGHNVVIGDFATLAPGVHVSGNVYIGKRVYIGTGAVLINGTNEDPLTIGEDVVIGAGACVTKSVPAGATCCGVPAKPVQH